MKIRCSSRFVSVLLGLGVSLVNLAGDVTAPQPDFNQLLTNATAGDVQAQYQVGADYLYGTGVAKDYSQALTWLEKAAGQKNAPAMSALGWIYEQGLGQPKDMTKAFGWYLQAATGGDAYGQWKTGDCYRTGLGVAHDDTQSAAWYKKAALQGNLEAQTRLAIDYLNGQGVEKDAKQAYTYFLNAAYTGSGWAQYNVAQCYWLGIFVPRDPAQAYKWAKLSSETYHEQIELDLMRILTAQLTPSQMAEGERLLKNWPREQWGDDQEDPVLIVFATGKCAQFPFELVGNTIVIQATVQNHPNLHFVVDTGAQSTLLDEQTASFLGITGGQTYAPTFGIGRDIFLSTFAQNVDLSIAGLSLPKTSFCLVSLSTISQGLGKKIDGMLGFDLLKHFAVGIDFTHKTITLTDPQAFQADPSQAMVDLDVYASAIYVNATIFNNNADAGPVKLRIDTGCDVAFMLSRSFVQSHAALNLSGKVESESGGLGGTTNENETRCSQIQVGDIIFKNPVIHLVQDNQGIWVYGLPWLIGNEALRRFDFTIDFADKKLFFKKNSNFDDPYDHTSTGLGVLATGPDLKILKVVDVSLGSPAAKAGFQTGDILLKIDDIDISQMKRDEARSLFIKEGLHHVVVERNGQPVMLEFQMDDPLKN